MNVIDAMKTSNRSKVESFRAMDVFAAANKEAEKGRDIILMCVGQPDAPAPSTSLKAASDVLAGGKISYTNGPGIDPLRARISRYYADKHGLDVDPARVFVTTGSSAGFILSFLALFDAGERIAIPSPGYPAYRNILKALSLEPVEIETTAQSGWLVTPELLEKAHGEKAINGILIASPNNPNGTMMSRSALGQLREAARQLSISFISDEIYHGLAYTMEETSALSFGDDAIIINSFSKYFSMTGFRVGWMVVPEELIGTIGPLQQNAFICAPQLSQIAALHAFDGMDEMERVKQGYAKNRQLFLDRLPELGIKEVQPIDGAFYAYANVSHLGMNSMDLAMRLLKDAGVALTPGADFDSLRGGDWMRFSFAGNHERMAEGFDRLKDWVSKYG